MNLTILSAIKLRLGCTTKQPLMYNIILKQDSSLLQVKS